MSQDTSSCLLLASRILQAHELAKMLHGKAKYFLVDCRPVLAYNTSHICGAVNVNFTGMMKKRFIAGKISLSDLVPSEEGKEKFRSCCNWPTVVYDDNTSDFRELSSSNTILLVVKALSKNGNCPYLLKGGIHEFGVLHPSLCDISVPPSSHTKCITSVPNPTTPGVREHALDWKTAPPVHVLTFLVLGSEKDAKSNEIMQDFKVKYVLNVTPGCPNMFEGDGMVYKRISVSDTGSQMLSKYFNEAFEFIELARQSQSCVLIHCMAGISRSVTITIAYLMCFFGLTMQKAYQFVKDRRPAISPNLNFMGQLVEFERQLHAQSPERECMDLESFLPTSEQLEKSERIMIAHGGGPAGGGGGGVGGGGGSGNNTPDRVSGTSDPPFKLRPLGPKQKSRSSWKTPGSPEVKENYHQRTTQQQQQQTQTQTTVTTSSFARAKCRTPSPRIIEDAYSSTKNSSPTGTSSTILAEGRQCHSECSLFHRQSPPNTLPRAHKGSSNSSSSSLSASSTLNRLERTVKSLEQLSVVANSGVSSSNNNSNSNQSLGSPSIEVAILH